MGSRRHPALAEAQGVRSCSRRAAAGAPVVLAALLLLAGTRQLFLAGDAAPTPPNTVALDGLLEDLAGAQVVWQLPAAGSGRPRGLLITFHGCSHSATDWWPRGPGCGSCIGLPEEVAITSTALARGYGVLAISSSDRQRSKCWALPSQPGGASTDTTAVAAAVHAFVQRQQLQGVPLLALGASSGGALALALPHHLKLAAVCSQIMALPRQYYAALLQASAGAPGTPTAPALFVHMSRDTRTAAAVADAVALRSEQGLASHVVEVAPQPITAAFLARVPELARSPAVRSQLVGLLRAHGFLDDASLLAQDPRHTHWRRVVRESSIPGAAAWSLTPDASGLSEVLNVAWAGHEIVSDTTTQTLDWFEQQLQQQRPTD